LTIGCNGSGTLNIPLPDQFQGGQEFTFTPTVRPIVDFWTQFSIAGSIEASFDLLQIGEPLIDDLPSAVQKIVEQAWPQVSWEHTLESPYTKPWVANVFDPYEVAGVALEMGEVSILIN
jgi:hypothetical protein